MLDAVAQYRDGRLVEATEEQDWLDEQNAPVLEYRDEDSDDAELLARIGYDHETGVLDIQNPSVYHGDESSDEELSHRNAEGSDFWRDVVPDEAQFSKRMPAQDWALKHEKAARLFAETGEGNSMLQQDGGGDALIINAQSNQHGRITGEDFAWSGAAGSTTEPAEEVHGALVRWVRLRGREFRLRNTCPWLNVL